MDGLDELWADLLSGDAERIRCAWDGLAHTERQALLDHLARMRHDEGWQPAQREFAVAAEKVIHDLAG
jgi:hypothetical protein